MAANSKMGNSKEKSESFFDKYLAYILIIPALSFLAIFAVYPILDAVWLSMHEYMLNMPALGQQFIGLDNYINIFQDDRFYSALYNTVYFTVFSVSLELIFGLTIALLINRAFVGRGLVRATTLIPWAIPTVVAGMMWRFMYNDQIGIVNDILVRLGIMDQYVSFLGSRASALWAVIIADVWKTTPFMALLLIAGLQVIPDELYEQAKIDGANTWQRFYKITMPLLKPALLVALLFRTLDAFRVFDMVVVMTGGGPGNSTETLSMYAHTTMMRYLDFGTGSALAVITIVIVMLISLVFVKVLGIKVEKG
ncbi:sugar ABC transporter permease [Alkalibacterium psychrotolerans]